MRIGLLAGEEPARLDSGDLLGDVEQGIENGFDFESGSEEVTAFQEVLTGPESDTISSGKFPVESRWCSEEVQRCRKMPCRSPMLSISTEILGPTIL